MIFKEEVVCNLRRSGEIAIQQYLMQRPITTGNTEIDDVLEGGVEAGNFYLFLGSAKNGKSTILRSIGMKIASKHPVLYLNFEQLGRNVFGKLYQLKFGSSLREDVHMDINKVYDNIGKMPDIPFFVTFWTDDLEEKSFNKTIAPLLKKSVDWITEHDEMKRKPVIFIENLSDIYNERVHATDSMVNIVTQTAQDIKNFMMKNETCCFLAHHTGKIQGDEPTLDDVRDSKRVVDLAYAIFSAYINIVEDPFGREQVKYHLKYMAGRGSSVPKKWDVKINGLEMTLTELRDLPKKRSKL